MVSAATIPCIAPLFVPGDRPDRFARAAASGADGIIIDLEDAVAATAKGRARQAVAAATLPGDIPVFLRINPPRTVWFRDDLALAAALPGIGVMLPKVASVADIEAVHQGTGRDRPLIVLLESAAGIANVRSIATAAGISRLAFGSIDYCADLGCAPVREALLMPRLELVLASRLAGLAPPLDDVMTGLTDDQALADAARYAAELGFGGKLCIHPRQIPQVIAGFTPTPQQLAWAQQVLSLDGNGASVTAAGQFVDSAVLRRARAIIARYRRVSTMQADARQGAKDAEGTY